MALDQTLLDTPGSDEWWVKRLSGIIASRTYHIQRMQAWYAGEAPEPDLDAVKDANTRAAYKNLVRISRLNLASLLVDARLPRMRINGVRTGADNSEDGDDIVRDIIQAENLRTKLNYAWRDALVTGRGYIVRTTDGLLHSSVRNTACVTDAHGNVAAALTVYVDEMTQESVMLLARPGYVREARAKDLNASLPNVQRNVWAAPGDKVPNTWNLIPGSWDLSEPQSTGMDSVPVYEFSLDKGIISKHENTLLRINHMTLQRGVMFATQAFKQQGIENAPMYDENNNKIEYSADAFRLEPGALWTLPMGAKFWESSAVDVGPLQNAINSEIRELAAESRTPLFMVSPSDGGNSAESALTQREPLLFDIESLEDSFTATLKRMFSDALHAVGEGEDRADPAKMMIDWVDPRRASATERAASVATATGAGVPLAFALKKFGGFTPEEVEEATRESGLNKLVDTLTSQASAAESIANPYGAITPGQEEAPAQPDQKAIDTTVNLSPGGNRQQQELANAKRVGKE